MRIEQIETNKIQVTFSKEDLDNNKINFHSLMSNSKQTQNFFLAVLDIAKKEMGFDTLNYDITIETLVLKNTDFILTISRKKCEVNNSNNELKITRKKYNYKNTFKFSNFNDFYDFYNKIKFRVQYSKSLYFFNNNFYYIYNEKNPITDESLLLEYAKASSIPADCIKLYGKLLY